MSPCLTPQPAHPSDQSQQSQAPSVSQHSLTGVCLSVCVQPEALTLRGQAAFTCGEAWGDKPLRSRAASSPRSAPCTGRVPDWQELADRDGLTENRCRMAVATLLYKGVVLGWKHRPIHVWAREKAKPLLQKCSHNCVSWGPSLGHHWATSGAPLEHLQHQVLSVGELYWIPLHQSG